MSREDLTARLMEEWDFDQADLEANRSGQLSARQLAGVRQRKGAMRSIVISNRNRGILIMLLFAIIGGGLVRVMISQSTGSGGITDQIPQVLAIIAAVIVGVLALLVFSARRQLNGIAAMQNEPIELLTASGPAEYLSETSYGDNREEGVRVGDKSFFVGKESQKTFVEGENYRMYYIEIHYYRSLRVRELMSAEAL